MRHSTKKINIQIGEKFNRLTILDEVGRGKFKERQVRCQCECGVVVITGLHLIRSGQSKSCGCLQKEHASSQGKLNTERSVGNTYRLDKRETEVSRKYPESYGKCRGSYANTIINQVRQKATQRNKEWTISLLDAFELCLQPCLYCGKEVNFPETRNGIDRIDNNIGYIDGNCVSCCRQCNSAKLELSLFEFKQFISNLAERINKW